MSRAHGAADGSESEILCLAFVEVDTPLLASAGNDRVVRCWSLRNNTCALLSMLEVSKAELIVVANSVAVFSAMLHLPVESESADMCII